MILFTSFTSVPILTLSAIDFFANKELLMRTPQLYRREWYQPRLTKKNFILNMIASIIESCVILGCLYLFFPAEVTADAGRNMVSTVYMLHI